eukprot:3991909-Prymnesium_polylepis.2
MQRPSAVVPLWACCLPAPDARPARATLHACGHVPCPCPCHVPCPMFHAPCFMPHVPCPVPTCAVRNWRCRHAPLYRAARRLLEVQRRYGKRLVIIVTELTSGKERQLTPERHPELPLRLAVRMSMGVPGLMEPVRYNGHLYCDGGMTNDFPMHGARPRARGREVCVCRPRGMCVCVYARAGVRARACERARASVRGPACVCGELTYVRAREE